MSTDLHDRLSDAYPQSDIRLPQAERLWERGGRRRRHRTAALAVAVTAVVVSAGVGVAALDRAPTGPPPLLTQPSETGADATEDRTAPGSHPEPATEGDVAVADDAARFDVSLFLCDGQLCPEISPDERQQLHDDLEVHPAVAEVFFESKEQALERFRVLFEDQPELADSVDFDTLPASFRVKLHDPEQVAAIAEEFAAYPGVEEVVDQRNCSPGACEGFVPEVADQP